MWPNPVTCSRHCHLLQTLSPAPGSSNPSPHRTMCVLPWLQPELLTPHHPGVGSGCKAGWGEGLTPAPPLPTPSPPASALSQPLGLVASSCRVDPKTEVTPQGSPQDPPPKCPTPAPSPLFSSPRTWGTRGERWRNPNARLRNGAEVLEPPFAPRSHGPDMSHFAVTRLARGSGGGTAALAAGQGCAKGMLCSGTRGFGGVLGAEAAPKSVRFKRQKSFSFLS